MGLIFDGNIQSLPGYFVYDAAVNRAVSVDSRGMLEALQKVYNANWIADELTGGAATKTAAPDDVCPERGCVLVSTHRVEGLFHVPSGFSAGSAS